MGALDPWPDPHDLLFELLDEFTDAPVVGPLLYENFQVDMPLIRVRKVGGTNDKISDFPIMAVDVYSATYAATRAIAEGARQKLMAYPHLLNSGRLDRVEVQTSPFEVPWPDSTTRYFTATYQISTRR